MTIKDFVSEQQYETIRQRIKERKVFCHEQSATGGGNKITVSLCGRYVEKETADKIWNGNDYLVSININYHGKVGIGGSGFATDKLEKFASWDSFKCWLDSLLERFDSYEADGQMCLF